MISNKDFKKKSLVQMEKEVIAKLKQDKKKTYFRIPGEGKPGEYRNIVAPYTPALAVAIRAKYPPPSLQTKTGTFTSTGGSLPAITV